jgi:hypothetical protein
MKIKVGDNVKFLNDTGSGKVTRIIDQKTALVQIDGGFEVPCLLNNLVVDKGSYSPDDEVEEEVYVPIKEEAPTTFSETIIPDENQSPIEDEEVLLAFLPDDSSSDFGTYLINSSSYLFKYTISRQQQGELVLFQEGTLEPGIKINLGAYKPGNINDEEFFRVQGLFYNAGFFNHISPLDILVKVSASDMYSSNKRKENDYFLEKAILHTLYDWRFPKKEVKKEMEIDPEELQKAMLTKGDIKPEKKVEVPKPTIEEVDLHIELLLDKFNHLSSGEIVAIQIARFRTTLETAILHKTKKIVFIHGVGNGKLKHEIRKILDTEYRSKARYQDASFKEYGYGATMVLVK